MVKEKVDVEVVELFVEEWLVAIMVLDLLVL